MTEEQKEKYGAFLNKVSEILGLNKPVDVLKLCAVTDEYIAPFQKHISELEKDCKYFSDNLDLQIEATLKLQNENTELKKQIKKMRNCFNYKHEKDACINPCSPKAEKWEMKEC